MHGQYQSSFSDLPTAYLQVCLKLAARLVGYKIDIKPKSYKDEE